MMPVDKTLSQIQGITIQSVATLYNFFLVNVSCRLSQKDLRRTGEMAKLQILGSLNLHTSALS